jgi:hypothetical protein
VGFFAKLQTDDVAHFDDSGPDVHADLQWVFVASHFLINFEAVMDRIEALLPALSAQGAAEAPNLPRLRKAVDSGAWRTGLVKYLVEQL